MTREGQWVSSNDCSKKKKLYAMTKRDSGEGCVIYGIVFVSVSVGSNRNREIDMCTVFQVQAELKVKYHRPR